MDDSKELIAYCGLYCGDCFNYKGEIADLSRDLRKKLRETKFDVVSQGLSKFLKSSRNTRSAMQYWAQWSGCDVKRGVETVGETLDVK